MLKKYIDANDDSSIQVQPNDELALDAINFSDADAGKVNYTLMLNENIDMATGQYYTTNIIELNDVKNKDYSNNDSVVILMNVGG